MAWESVAREPDERGASATEYGLIVVAIAALIAVVVFALGAIVNDTYSQSCENIKSEAAPTSSCS